MVDKKSPVSKTKPCGSTKAKKGSKADSPKKEKGKNSPDSKSKPRKKVKVDKGEPKVKKIKIEKTESSSPKTKKTKAILEESKKAITEKSKNVTVKREKSPNKKQSKSSSQTEDKVKSSEKKKLIISPKKVKKRVEQENTPRKPSKKKTEKTENYGKDKNSENIKKGRKRSYDQMSNSSKTKVSSPVKSKSPKLQTHKQKLKSKELESHKLKAAIKLKRKQTLAKKKKLESEHMTKSLLDIFSLVRMKREASLNASARVNIMFEKVPPSPKTKTENSHGVAKVTSEPQKDETVVISSDSKEIKPKPIKTEKTKKSSQKTETKQKSSTKQSAKTKKEKLSKEIKKVKDKKKKDKSVAPVQGCVRRMASLNAQAIMAATKEFEAESSERAARIDRYCVAWQYEPLTTKVSSAAQWVDGLGKTCYVTQTSTCFTSTPKSDTASVSEGPKVSAITLTPVDAESVDERPASVVDVTSHITSSPNPFLPLSAPQQCIGSFFTHNHSCVPPCTGCSNDNYMASSQFKSFQFNSLNSLNSLQMMTYGHPGHHYRSAFSVPFNHAGLPHYGYYSNSYYQPTTGPVISSDPCIVSHHVPIQVPQAQVKVLIHNPDSNLDHCAFSDSTVKGSKEGSPLLVQKRRSSSEAKNKKEDKSKVDQLKPKRKYERKRSKSPGKEDSDKVSKKVAKTTVVVEKPVIPAHGWSSFGEPELKKIPNVVEGPPRHRKCYSAMKHVDGDIIHVRDCVLLRSGPRKKDIPFVAKVSALWENPDDGEIMMSLLWYYRPEHTEAGRKTSHLDNEVFACKHRDENSVACIDDKSYVLTYNEYCRYKAEQCRSESHLPPRQNVVPPLEDKGGNTRERIPPLNANPDNVFLCRQVYDLRQHRILKNPS